MMLKVTPKFVPQFDPEFVPAVLWNRAYRDMTKKNPKSEKLAICMKRNNGAVSRFNTEVLPHTGANKKLNIRYVERLVKYMLWMYGGQTVTIGGNADIAAAIEKIYSPKGERQFDYGFFSEVYGHALTVVNVPFAKAPKASEITVALGGNTDGVRIGFDLGGSDRKYALMVDGKVVDSGETEWDPYHQTDWMYHAKGLRDTIKQAMKKIPKGRFLEGIGGSSAGVLVDNLIPMASLLRGVRGMAESMPERALNLFEDLRKELGVPLITINDGEVTALLGAQEQKSTGVLGISMGTSVAGGYVNAKGNITDWLNELAFVPCDYRENGPEDEWSKDRGCCVQYFCQQGVARIAKQAGMTFPEDMKDPEKLKVVQELMAKGDAAAVKIYESIGIMFGYTIAYFAEFYDIKKLLILGRVTSGKGGDLILETAEKVLKAEFPKLAKSIAFCIPDEKNKRHGQAAAAATLPVIAKVSAAKAKMATAKTSEKKTAVKADPIKKDVVKTVKKEKNPMKKAVKKEGVKPVAKKEVTAKTAPAEKHAVKKAAAKPATEKTVVPAKKPATVKAASTVKPAAKKVTVKAVAKPAPATKKTAPKAAAKPAPAKKAAPVKKAVTAKAVPAAKPAAKKEAVKAVAKPVPAKKAAPKTAVKAAPAKKPASTKKTTAKKK